MARPKLRQKAIELRKKGRTFSEIKESLGVSKSTLSYWLGKYPLTQEQMAKLERNIKKRKFLAIEKIRNTKAKKRQQRLNKVYIEEKTKMLPLTTKELYLSGLFLYWGEGVKGLNTTIGLNNTDPRVIKFYLYWLLKGLKIPKKKIRVYIHLYKDMDVEIALNYWSKELSIPKLQFTKPYIKESNRRGLTHKGYGHGTCGLYVNDVRLKEKIMLGIDAIADFYAQRLV